MLVSGPQTPFMAAVLTGEAALQPQIGQVLQGMVQATDEGLFLIAGQVRIQLPANTDLTSGQTVTAEVLARNTQDGSLQLRMTPQTTAAATTTVETTQPAAAESALINVAQTVLRTLGVLEVPENATTLLPAQLPPTAETARAALAFFVVRAQIGTDIEQTITRIQEAIQAGVPVREETRAAVALLNRLVAAEPDSFEPVLRQWLTDAAAPTESRAAQALASGSPERFSQLLQTDVRAALTQVHNDGALTNYLRTHGELRDFQSVLTRVTDRVTGGQLQNTRGTDIPYWVTEIPFAPGGSIRDGLIHFLPEGRRNRSTAASSYATVALDLSTTHLGNLWITLQAGSGECHCRILANESAAVETLHAATDELQSGLVNAGYARPTVQIANWDGNRLRETASLLQRYAGFQVNV